MADQFTLAARIARTPLESLEARRRWPGLERARYFALCDAELDTGLDAAAVAIAAHTTPEELTRELELVREA